MEKDINLNCKKNSYKFYGKYKKKDDKIEIEIEKTNNTIPSVIILEEKNKIIDKWFHISDIHIPERKGFNDYKILFDELFKKIKKYGKPYENTIILITGNLLDKGAFSMDPKTHELCCYFYEGMLNYCDIFTIHGNRDLIGSTKYSNNNPLEHIIGNNFSKKFKNKSYILNNNSNYVYNDIVLCPTQYNTRELTKCVVKNKFSIGLYNGLIYNQIEKEFFSVEDFEKNYDSTHLGYIHKRQNLSKKGNVWYSGSFKQLNSDEEIEKGIILFSQKCKKNKFIRLIDNSINYHIIEDKKDLENINFNSDKIILTIRRNNIDNIINKLKEMEKYNDKIEIKIMPEKLDYKKLNFDMNINGKKFDIDIKNKEDIINIAIDYAKNNIKDSNGNFLNEKILEEIKNKINEKSENLKYESTQINKNISIKFLKFDNILIYGGENQIDFTKMKGIISLSGKNGIGKSSLIDAIFVAIYGICSKGTYKMIVKKGSIDKITKNKNEEAGFFETYIEFSVNDINYVIERKYESNGNSQTNNCNIYFYEKDPLKVILKSKSKNDWKVGDNTIGKKNVGVFDELIKKYLCSYEDFRLNFFMLQKSNEIGFVNMTDIERNNFLLKVFKIDIFNDIAENIKKWKDKLSTTKKINTELFMKDNIYFDKLKINERIIEIKTAIEKENELFIKNKENKIEINKKKKDIENKIKKYEKNNEYYNSYIIKYETIENIEDINNDKNEIEKKILDIENILKKENKELKKNKDEIKSVKNIISKNNKKKKLIEINNNKILENIKNKEIKKNKLEKKIVQVNDKTKNLDFYEKIIDKIKKKKKCINDKYVKLIDKYDNNKLSKTNFIKELKKIVRLSNDDVEEELNAKKNIELYYLKENLKIEK